MNLNHNFRHCKTLVPQRNYFFISGQNHFGRAKICTQYLMTFLQCQFNQNLQSHQASKILSFRENCKDLQVYERTFFNVDFPKLQIT